MNKANVNMSDIIQKLEQLDYSLIFNIIKPIIICYISKTAINKGVKYYKINKDFKTNRTIKIDLPSEVIKKHQEVDKERIKKQKFGYLILEFYETLMQKMPNTSLNLLCNNLNTLTISIRNFKIYNLFTGNKTLGDYCLNDNHIRLIKDNKELFVIAHELFHMASTFIDDKKEMLFSGFMQIKNGNNIVEGLNEGYTQLLTERYFENSNKISKVYLEEKSIAKKLEIIVEKEKMETLYLTANLSGLITELEKYMDTNSILQFLTNIDFLHRYSHVKTQLPMKNKMLISKLKSSEQFLLTCYLKKLQIQILKGEIDEETFYDKIAIFLEMISARVVINKVKYNVFTVSELAEIINNSLDNFGIIDFDLEVEDNKSL